MTVCRHDASNLNTKKENILMQEQMRYYYGNETDQYSFYRIPKLLFTDTRFRQISAKAKVLYGFLLDRMALSMKNHGLDEEGRGYIIFTIAEVMEALGCAEQKANRLLSELDTVKGAGLIERKRRGLGKPNRIYVNPCEKLSMWILDTSGIPESGTTNPEL
jgi:hypothetical protein